MKCQHKECDQIALIQIVEIATRTVANVCKTHSWSHLPYSDPQEYRISTSIDGDSRQFEVAFVACFDLTLGAPGDAFFFHQVNGRGRAVIYIPPANARSLVWCVLTQDNLTPPFTYQLFAKILNDYGPKLKRATIFGVDHVSRQYLARLEFTFQSNDVSVDCQIFDAIGMASAAGVPIYFEQGFFEDATFLGWTSQGGASD